MSIPASKIIKELKGEKDTSITILKKNINDLVDTLEEKYRLNIPNNEQKRLIESNREKKRLAMLSLRQRFDLKVDKAQESYVWEKLLIMKSHIQEELKIIKNNGLRENTKNTR